MMSEHGCCSFNSFSELDNIFLIKYEQEKLLSTSDQLWEEIS